jgi:hypothetical protein
VLEILVRRDRMATAAAGSRASGTLTCGRCDGGGDDATVAVSVLLRFVVPFKSLWLHETACIKLMVNETNDGVATLWALNAAIFFKHPNSVFECEP